MLNVNKGINVNWPNLAHLLNNNRMYQKIENTDKTSLNHYLSSFLSDLNFQAEMTVKIRLARLGCKHRPFYRVVVADDKSRRDGKQIEVLGFYDPLQGKEDANRVSLKFDRIQYWLSVGAQPTDTVENMLFRAGLIPPKPMVVVGSKNGQQSTSQHVSPITGEILN